MLPSQSGTVVSRSVVAVGAALAVASLAVLLIGHPEGVTPSRDTGAPTVPLPVVLAPSLIGIALTLVVSHRRPLLAVRTGRRSRLFVTTGALGALAVVFPLAVGLVDPSGEDYVLAKALLLIALPALIVATLRGAITIDAPRTAWRWWAPAVVVLAWAAILGLTRSSPDYSGMDASTLMIAATATAVTAGFGEELFYRRLLQTRLEAWLGSWAGIVIASMAFALMHLGSHGTGDPVRDIASAIVVQGSFGLFMGVLWQRYRNFTAIVVAHILANGWHEITLSVLLR